MNPNIVWLTLDSIRADCMSINGYYRETTPYLDSVARSDSGGNFSKCFAHSIWSLESAASLMSGLYPSAHRVGGEHQSLNKSIYTIPERLSDAGYHTVGISANPWFSTDFGLSQGFDVFVKSNKRNITSAGYFNVLKYLLQIREHSSGLTTRFNTHKSEYISKKVISRYIKSASSTKDPLFLYAHTEGVHTPYFPPGKTHGTFSEHLDVSAERARERAYEINEKLYSHIASGADLSPGDMEVLKTMYDELLYYVDTQVRDIFRVVEKTNSRPTVVVVTSDHGELFGEDDLLYHILTTHDALTRVPCIIDGLKYLDLDKSMTNGLVQHNDIMKTILGAVGAETRDIHGYDLRSESREAAVIQRSGDFYQKSVENIRDERTEVSLELDQFLPGFTTAIRTNSFKFVTDDESRRLYSMPDEKSDIQASKPDVLSELQECYDELKDRFFRDQKNPEHTESVSTTVEKRLQELGYK